MTGSTGQEHKRFLANRWIVQMLGRLMLVRGPNLFLGVIVAESAMKMRSVLVAEPDATDVR